jgi:NADPH:quinone reductase-like Zn-dependent oxidoreductase
MTRTRKVLSGLLAFFVVAIVALAIFVSHDAACGAAPALPNDATPMKAVVYRCYGGPEVLRVENIAKPTPADNEVLVKVRAAAVNPLDWHYMRGEPYLVRVLGGFGVPENPRLGVDFAGTVEAVGKNVTRFHVGDDVFGGRTGAFAEYVVVREDRAITSKPANMTFEQAASAPIAAITALQALRDKGQLEPGQKVLINGASGGVGTFAVQIAKALGAEVTGVCSTRNVEMVRSLGADHVIDYTKENFTNGEQRYDLIIDNVSSHGLLDNRRVLTPSGRHVIVGSLNKGRWLGPMIVPIKATLLSPFVEQKFEKILAELNREDLKILADLMASGKVTPVIEKRYDLSELPAAIAYVEAGHARGKVVIGMDALPTS